jgi:hypothetical protein
MSASSRSISPASRWTPRHASRDWSSYEADSMLQRRELAEIVFDVRAARAIEDQRLLA